MNHRILSAILLLVSVVGCQTPRMSYQTSEWHLKYRTGTVLESDHYVIYTTVKDTDFHAAAVDLAEGEYQRFKSAVSIEPKEKMTLFIFSDVRQWVAFTNAKFTPEQAAVYMRIRNGGYTADNFSAFYYMGRYATLTILAHELFHLYINLAAGPEQIPAWVNEGMATYFEAHEWDVNRVVFTPKKNLFRRQNLSEAIAANRLFTLRELLKTHAGEVVCLPMSKVLAYYAEVWALIQYLQDPASGEYHKNFQNLLCELGTHDMTMKIRGFLTTVREEDNVSTGEALFRVYITDDLDQFDRDFQAYLPKLTK